MTACGPTALREVGFLTVDQPATEDIEAAVMTMLTAAWKAGVRAAEAPSSPPPEDDSEAAARRVYLEKLARIQA